MCAVLYMHRFIIANVTVHSTESMKPVEVDATAALILLFGFEDPTVSTVDLAGIFPLDLAGIFTGTFTVFFIISGILKASFGIKFSDDEE